MSLRLATLIVFLCAMTLPIFLLPGDHHRIITLSGASAQGRWFKEVSLMAKVLNDELPDVPVNGVTGKGGSAGNVKRIAGGKIDAGRFYHFDIEDAITGKPPFNQGDYSNVRVWMKLGTHIFRVVAVSTVKTLGDLKGLRIAVGIKGSGDDRLAARILAAYDVTPSNSRFHYVGRTDGQAALANSQIDAIAFAYARNNRGHLSPLFAAREIGVDIDFVEPGKNIVTAFLAENKTFFLDTGGEPVFDRPDLAGIGFYNGLLISDELPEELVYSMTKAVFTHWEELLKSAPWWAGPGEASLEAAPAMSGVPYHRGAIRFYKEVGVWPNVHPE